MSADKVSCKHLLDAPFAGNSFQQAHMTGRIGFQQIRIRIALFGNNLFRSIGHQSRIHIPIIAIQAIEKALDIPGMSVKFVINRIENLTGKLHAMFSKVRSSETGIRHTINGTNSLQLRTLIERPFRRREHLLHQMLFAAGKDEVHIGKELDIGAQQSFNPFLWIFSILLKLVISNISPFL